MKIKIVTHNGVMFEALSDTEKPEDLEIEAIQIDTDAPDRDRLVEYENALYRDPSLKSVPYTSANFEDC